MTSLKYAFQQTLRIALGQLICCILMLMVYALLGRFSAAAILGAATGALLACANFFVMALCAGLAADKGQAQDVSAGKALIQFSYIGRMLLLFVILALCAKSGVFDLIALVLPLVFVRPILTVSELFTKKGGKST